MPEPERRAPNGSNDPSVRRLTRLQQLTLNTWRRASAQVSRDVSPTDILAHVAIHAALAVLRDTNSPIALCPRHDARAEEFALVASVAPPASTPSSCSAKLVSRCVRACVTRALPN